MTDRLKGSEIKPITFDNHADAAKFIRAHVCSMCRGHLTATHNTNREWIIKCLLCETLCFEHNVTTPYKIEQIETEEFTTETINREHGRIEPDKIIKELGFNV